MTSNIKNLAYHKYYLKQKAIKFNSSNYQEAYKRCRNELNEVIKATKARYYNTKLQNSKTSKEGWNTLNNLLNRQSKATTVNELNIGHGNKITDRKDIVDEFNKFFTSIGPNLAKNITDSDTSPHPLSYMNHSINAFSFENISIHDIKREIKNLEIGKSTGLDKISTKLVKQADETICESLVYISVNLSLETGIFPDDWKLAKVTPIV
jgi:hypothetical protein